MTRVYNGKSKGKSGIKKAMKRTVKPPIYRAWFGARAPVAPSKKYVRYTKKWRKFEQVVQLIKRQHEPGITDTERVASSNLATAICKRSGVDLQEALDEVEYRKNKYNGGKSVVIIKHRNKVKCTAVRQQTFLVDLCDSIEMSFDCSAYTEHKDGTLRVTFYGVAGNTISAQLAFQIAYNSAMEMGQVFPGNGPRNSYLLGVAAGLWDKAMYRKVAIEKEIERARKMAATTFRNEDFNTDENYEADFDFDNGLPPQVTRDAKDKIKTEDDDSDSCNTVSSGKAMIKANRKFQGDDEEEDDEEEDGESDQEEDEEDESDEGGEDDDNDDKDDDDQRDWVQHMLVLADYRTKVEKAAAAWLAEQGIKLRAQRKGKKIIRFPRTFEEGKDDSNDIDFGEKRICGTLKKDIKLRGKGKARAKEEDDDSD